MLGSLFPSIRVGDHYELVWYSSHPQKPIYQGLELRPNKNFIHKHSPPAIPSHSMSRYIMKSHYFLQKIYPCKLGIQFWEYIERKLWKQRYSFLSLYKHRYTCIWIFFWINMKGERGHITYFVIYSYHFVMSRHGWVHAVLEAWER